MRERYIPALGCLTLAVVAGASFWWMNRSGQERRATRERAAETHLLDERAGEEWLATSLGAKFVDAEQLAYDAFTLERQDALELPGDAPVALWLQVDDVWRVEEQHYLRGETESLRFVLRCSEADARKIVQRCDGAGDWSCRPMVSVRPSVMASTLALDVEHDNDEYSAWSTPVLAEGLMSIGYGDCLGLTFEDDAPGR